MYFVLRAFFKDGKQSNSIEMRETEIDARKRYYTILATDIDSETIEYELVQIVREDGTCNASQVFDNRVEE